MGEKGLLLQQQRNTEPNYRMILMKACKFFRKRDNQSQSQTRMTIQCVKQLKSSRYLQRAVKIIEDCLPNRAVFVFHASAGQVGRIHPDITKTESINS